MADPTLNRLRRLWFTVHMWVGIGLLVVLVPLTLSGVILAWRPELDRATHPERYAGLHTGPALGPSALVSAASHAFRSGASVDRLVYPVEAGAPVVALSDGRQAAWIDPATGAVLAKGRLSDPLTNIAHDMHEQLFMPKVGRPLVGVLGVFLLAQVLTGLWLWWPRSGGILQGLSWRRSRFLDARLHYLVGFCSAIPLAILAATGVLLAFPLHGPQQRLAGPPRAPPAGGAEPSAALSADQALAAARSLAPGARVTMIFLPTPGTPVWRLQMLAPGGNGPVTVRVPQSGAPPNVSPSGPTDPVSLWSGRLHAGETLGPVWRWIITLGGLAPTLLAVTGLLQWLRGRGRPTA